MLYGGPKLHENIFPLIFSLTSDAQNFLCRDGKKAAFNLLIYCKLLTETLFGAPSRQTKDTEVSSAYFCFFHILLRRPSLLVLLLLTPILSPLFFPLSPAASSLFPLLLEDCGFPPLPCFQRFFYSSMFILFFLLAETSIFSTMFHFACIFCFFCSKCGLKQFIHPLLFIRCRTKQHGPPFLRFFFVVDMLPHIKYIMLFKKGI